MASLGAPKGVSTRTSLTSCMPSTRYSPLPPITPRTGDAMRSLPLACGQWRDQSGPRSSWRDPAVPAAFGNQQLRLRRRPLPLALFGPEDARQVLDCVVETIVHENIVEQPTWRNLLDS